MTDSPDIQAGRLGAEDYQRNFADVHPPLDRKRALVEANRCYFCYDAPCVTACPTTIDIPLFIRQISTDSPLPRMMHFEPSFSASLLKKPSSAGLRLLVKSPGQL